MSERAQEWRLARRPQGVPVAEDVELVEVDVPEPRPGEVLVRNAGRLVSQKQLLQEVWGPSYGTETNYLRVYMAQLRRKLEADPSHPRHFVTEPGMGYRFERGRPVPE